MVENMPEFSVLISLYNNEKSSYLDDCFNSLFIQTLPASEIVLVLDGPISKNLMTVVEKWKGKLPLKIFPITVNVGLGKALNYGLNKCCNDIVCRMDTDDICIPERFEKQINYLVKHPDLCALGSAIQEFNGKDKGKIRFSKAGHNNIVNYAKRRNPLNHMTVVFRKKYVLDVGGYLHHLYMEDYNLWLRLISAGYELDNLEEPLVNARVGEGMIKRRKGWRYIQSEYKLYMLKKQLGIDLGISAFSVLLIRASPRILPQCILSKLYFFLRK
ncbi:glycosyltransferase [Citrobacter sp. Marseille-Q6884]|uniref:glycosyltransferase n=1 Tax=Citrobacter sp. Marseille-Q6884 TaxID=2956786 RepID=UPI0021B24F39|nr:glycosyltransferase [Citrobacter sp. Marseille-Q6884]